jgi:hypothetical protein
MRNLVLFLSIHWFSFIWFFHSAKENNKNPERIDDNLPLVNYHFHKISVVNCVFHF